MLTNSKIVIAASVASQLLTQDTDAGVMALRLKAKADEDDPRRGANWLQSIELLHKQRGEEIVKEGGPGAEEELQKLHEDIGKQILRGLNERLRAIKA